MAELSTVQFQVRGMRCAGCVAAVERQLQGCPGVSAVSVNLVTSQATVVGQVEGDGIAWVSQLMARVEAAGFEALLGEGLAATEDRGGWVPPVLLALIALLEHGVVLPGGMISHGILACAALVWGGSSIMGDGLRAGFRRAPNMHTLVALGAIAAFGQSVVALIYPQWGWMCYFEEPVMLLAFVRLGEYLLERAKWESATAIQSLMSLQPATARVVRHGEDGEFLEEVSLKQVRVGDRLRVYAGERIPADGVVVSGISTVDESMVTGESLPVVKEATMAVTGGTINLTGVLTVGTTAIGSQSVLSQMVALVAAAQMRKSPLQRIVDRVAGGFATAVLALSLGTLVLWLFGVGIDPWVAWRRAIAVLVIACPCALGLATPTAVAVASGWGATRGILLKGGACLAKAERLSLVVFDKTGTLTQGCPQVTDSLALISPPTFWQWLASVEAAAKHPLGRAIATYAGEQGITVVPLAAAEVIPGEGISAQVNGTLIRIGRQQWLEHLGVEVPAAVRSPIDAWSRDGKTVVVAAQELTCIGCLAIEDPLRPDAGTAIATLQRMGLAVWMLSGDHHNTATAIAERVGIPASQVLAEVRPEGKAQHISQLESQGHHVAMVGDGINDAPALAAATLGIALGSGTDVAMASADVVLVRPQLAHISSAINLCRTTYGKIRQNLVWAFVYNCLGIPLAAGLFAHQLQWELNPAIAGLAMALSSVSVVLNSLALRYQRF
jgi:Cu2+-exporting ATPase